MCVSRCHSLCFSGLHGVLLVAIVLLYSKETTLSSVLFVLVYHLQQGGGSDTRVAMGDQPFEVRQSNLANLDLVLLSQRLAQQRLGSITELHKDESVSVYNAGHILLLVAIVLL